MGMATAVTAVIERGDMVIASSARTVLEVVEATASLVRTLVAMEVGEAEVADAVSEVEERRFVSVGVARSSF